MLDFSEKVDVAPADIDDGLTRGPIELDQVPEEQRDRMGLPGEINEWTGIKWLWDDRRMEFVPLKTILEEGPGAHPFLWDEQSAEFLSHEDWIARYGLS